MAARRRLPVTRSEKVCDSPYVQAKGDLGEDRIAVEGAYEPGDPVTSGVAAQEQSVVASHALHACGNARSRTEVQVDC